MRRPEPWQRVLSRVLHTAKTPYILRVGTGPPGSAPSLSSSDRPGAPLPVVAVNYFELSPFELDYALRCLDCAAVFAGGSTADGSDTMVDAAAQPSVVALMERDGAAAATWHPLFDAVVLPGGGLCTMWLRHHALDEHWTSCAETYFADLWNTGPSGLMERSLHKLQALTRQLLPMRHRHLNVFGRLATVTAAHLEAGVQMAVRSLHVAAAATHPLEDGALSALVKSRETVPLYLKSLAQELEQRQRELPTGTAIALMRLFVFASATYHDCAQSDMRTELVSLAERVCALTRDSVCHPYLTWATALLGGASAQTMSGASPTQHMDATAEALMLALTCVSDAPGEARESALRWHVERYLRPLLDALVSDEAVLQDTLVSFHFSGLNAADEVAVAAKTTLNAAAKAESSTGRTARLESDVSAFFHRALRPRSRKTHAAAVEPSELSPSRAPLALSNVPGAGTDTRGCWCALLTHAQLLLSYSRTEQRLTRSADAASLASAAERALRLLQVTLVRRCLYTPTEATIATQFSMLTHLRTTAERIPMRMTLIHLSPTSAAPEPADRPAHRQLLLGLLFLYPSLRVRSLYGGTVADASASLSDRSHSSVPAAGAEPGGAALARIPAASRESLVQQLSGRRSALICVVERRVHGAVVAFLAEDIATHLHFMFSLP
ncbi:hypothetical protein NESM_000718000 [Novymonas esmeraldas]|uniref:Uncharacterized protein n=1 Tax=Novymonas esmeraldas TaxID=1808958 RepID=A0AAW0ETU4_9TRYP